MSIQLNTSLAGYFEECHEFQSLDRKIKVINKLVNSEKGRAKTGTFPIGYKDTLKIHVMKAFQY